MFYRSLTRPYVAVALSCSLLAPASAFGGPLKHHQPVQPCVTYPVAPTEYRNGDGDGDLRLEITGLTRNVIEVYFGHGYFRDTFTNHGNLHFSSFSFPEHIDKTYTSFGVAYADPGCQSRFAVYGVAQPLQNRKLIKLTNDPAEVHNSADIATTLVQIDDRYPVTVRWLSTKVVRIGYGPWQSQTLALRFNPENEGSWEILGQSQ